MAKRRVQDGKRVDTLKVTTADGRLISIDLYMVRSSSPSYTPSRFVAVCDEIDLYEKGENLDEVTKRAEKLARERSEVQWTPWLYVTVRGSTYELSAQQVGGELFDERRCEWQDRLIEAFGQTIEIELVERAQVNGEWRWRYQSPRKTSRHAPTVHKGSPEVGRVTSAFSREGTMCSLLPDTPEVRSALVTVRSGFVAFRERLQDLLSPENAESTLASVNSGALLIGGVRRLVASTPSEEDEDEAWPLGRGDVDADDEPCPHGRTVASCFDCSAAERERIGAPSHPAEKEPGPRPRVKRRG